MVSAEVFTKSQMLTIIHGVLKFPEINVKIFISSVT